MSLCAQTNRRRCKCYIEQMGHTLGGHLKHTLHHLTLTHIHTHTHTLDAKSSAKELCVWTSGPARREQLPPASSSHHHRMRPEATGTYAEQRGHILPLRHDLTQLALTPLSLIMCPCVCVEGSGLRNISSCGECSERRPAPKGIYEK